jgi:hypothetical protein
LTEAARRNFAARQIVILSERRSREPKDLNRAKRIPSLG